MIAGRLPCATTPDLWFPASGNTAAGREQIQLAKALCWRCPERDPCLAAWRKLPGNVRDVGAVVGGVFFRIGTGEATRRHHADRSERVGVAA